MFRRALSLGVLGVGAAAASFSESWTGHSCADGEGIVVVGGGVMGAATALYLTTTGHKCLLIDDGYPFKSSWGESRVAREVQQKLVYQHLMKRAKELWVALEKEVGEELLLKTGILTFGNDDKVRKMREVNEQFGVAYEMLEGEQVVERFPALRLSKKEKAMYQEGGWIVLAEKAQDAMYRVISMKGGSVIPNDAVMSIDRKAKVVRTESGKTFSYKKLVLACGPQTNDVLDKAGLRQLRAVCSAEEVHYYTPKAGVEAKQQEDVSTKRLPILLDRTDLMLYAVPHIEGGVDGVKVSAHRSGPVLCGDRWPLPNLSDEDFDAFHAARSPITDAERCVTGLPQTNLKSVQFVNQWVASRLPSLNPSPSFSHRCVYTTTLADRPAVGPHPEDSDVVLACCFGGEGFKFAPAYGEAAALHALQRDQTVAALVPNPFSPDSVLVS